MDRAKAVTTPCTLTNTSEPSPERKKQAKQRRPAVIANVLNTEYDVIKEVLKESMHCKLSYEPEDEKALATKEWDLYWHDLIITPEMVSKLKPYQKVNHFPGMESLYRKNLLGKNLMRMRRLYPKEYSFFPPTWVLPVEWSDFKKQFESGKRKTFIVKPEAMSQGKGIFLTRNWAAIDPNEHCVVQRYLHRPFLIDGLKFDLRIYVLVYGCDPYRIYMYREGLVRLATEEYMSPTGANMDNLYMHLTNYAINKDNDNFEFNTDADKADTGHKRSLDFVWHYIEENGGDPAGVKDEIKRCIIKTFCAVQPFLGHLYRSSQPNDLANNKCFEILGFDILLDYKLKPWLLEVNHAPSFSTDTPFDYKTKSELLLDTFRLLHLDATKRLNYERKKQLSQQVKLVMGKGLSTKLTKEEKATKKVKKMRKRDDYELKNLGNFERLYPAEEDMAKYEMYIKAAGEVWEAFTGSKRRHVITKKEEESKKIPAIKPRVNPYMTKPGIGSARIPKKPPEKVEAQFNSAQQNTSCVTGSTIVEPIGSLHVAKSAFTEKVPKCRNDCYKTKPPVYAQPVINVLKGYSHSKSAAETHENSTTGTIHESLPKNYSRTEYDRKWRRKEGSVQVFSNANNAALVKHNRPKTRGGRPAPPLFNFVQRAPETSVKMSHKFAVPAQPNTVGIYVVPKVLEFIPFDIIAPVRGPTFSKNGWNPYRATKPYQRSQKPFF